MMRSAFRILILLVAGTVLRAQSPYVFSEISKLPATAVKDQGQTGTCWAFSSASFLESEVERLGKGTLDLSEMFIVRHVYRLKCDNYVRRQGTANLSQGGLSHDFMNAVQRYGIVTEEAYPGKKDRSAPHNHTELEKQLKTMCDQFVEMGKKGALPPDWLARVDTLLDGFFGPLPEKFKYNGGEFTPRSFRDFLGINPKQYIHLTSFTHHPYHGAFVLEVPDNFSNGSFYNLPIEDLMRIIQNALQNGYTVEWDADVSNEGFSRQKGLAIVPKKQWADKTGDEQKNTFVLVEEEPMVHQTYRQEMFDRQVTQDDHLMHIVGMADEASSGTFFIVKNSWGAANDQKGYVYASEAYVRLNTISITLHRDALPQDLQKRMALASGQGATAPTPVAQPVQPNQVAPDSNLKKLQKGTEPASKPKVSPKQESEY